ncbi:MAG TPA: hypothetical protein VH518_20420 [Tepidisphaeraceae bacterium]|jgi:hypothetical protein
MDVNWRPLSVFTTERFEPNLQALRSREPDLAQALAEHRPAVEYLAAPDAHRIQIGRRVEQRIEALPNPVPPTSAREVAKRLYPAGKCTEPAMVAGLDHGWIWHTLYQLDCDTPRTPGHRPPLYFLSRDIERLWLLLHIHDWATMLADPRVRLFVGPSAVERCHADMVENPHVPWAKLCVTIDPGLWPAGVTVDSLWQSAHQSANARMQQLNRQIEAVYAGTESKALARKLRGEKLRILGITSLYTTFLKYSMSDWLDAMDALGHETRLVIEQGDHEIANPLSFAEEIIQYRPDLILMIDHYRGEVAGLPKQVPCVMWVQDNLPNIFCAKAGASQGPRDYCLGFGRLNLHHAFGYPERRYMPAQVAVNEERFAPRELSKQDRETYGCDVSFVSHASVPATVLLTEQLNRADAGGRKLLIDIFEQMRGVYDSGGAITQPLHISRMIENSLMKQRSQIDEPTKRHLNDFFNQRVNNALFRHQALTWLADMDVNIHLYGRGWERHPRLGRYARGIACNQTQLCTIYQASRINLQVTPFGAVHQRLFEGLAAGGFFLLRYVPGDEIERVYRELHDWCASSGIETDIGLSTRATPHIRGLIQKASELIGVDPFQTGPSLIDVLKLSADGEYIRSAATVWDEYDHVAFRSSAELQAHVGHFLTDESSRRSTAESMRRVVLERFTYRSTSDRLLNFIADDLARDLIRPMAAA